MLQIIIILALIFLVDNSTALPTPVNFNLTDCYNNNNNNDSSPSLYPRNSPYETNLNNLLSTLATNVSRTENDGFVQYRQGDSNPAYGLAWCRADLNRTECRECVELGSTEVTRQCPRAWQAILWKEQCMLRYSNRSFFGILQVEPNNLQFNRNDFEGDDSEAWIAFVRETLNTVISMATAASDGPHHDNNTYNYATHEEVFGPTNTVWNTLAHCTPDLTKANCTTCLNYGLSMVRTIPLALGGIALTPSCTLRYEGYEFYRRLTADNAPTNTGTLTSFFHFAQKTQQLSSSI